MKPPEPDSPAPPDLENRLRELVLAGDAGRASLNHLLRTTAGARPMAAGILVEEAALISALRLDSVEQWAGTLQPRPAPATPRPMAWHHGRTRLLLAAAAVTASLIVARALIPPGVPETSPPVTIIPPTPPWIGWLRCPAGPESLPPQAVDNGETLEVAEQRARLDLANGVVISITGPAKLKVTTEECRLWSGQVSIEVPEDLDTYIVETDNGRFVDLGTTFSVSVQPGNRTEMAVLSGMVRAESFSYEGDVLARQWVRKAEGVVLEGQGRGIQSVRAHDLAHPAPIRPSDTPLHVPAAYHEAVASAGPLVHWDFESRLGPETIANRAGDRYPGVLHGALTNQNPGGEHLIMAGDHADGWVECPEPWAKEDATPFTIEIWARPDRIHWGHLVNLRIESPLDPVTGREPLGLLSYFALEITHNRVFPPMPTDPSVRCTFRSPATEHPESTLAGGVNTALFSPNRYVPGKWHHLVTRVDATEIALFIDGQMTSRRPIQRPDSGTRDLWIRLGGIRHQSGQHRQFEGAIDEFAIYPRALSDKEIRRHHELMSGGHAR